MEEEEFLQGVLSFNEAALWSIERRERLDAADMVMLWKGIHASSSLVADNVGQRLQNYFWRILAGERIVQRLSGRQVFAHITAITEGDNIRTTPRGSPRSSRNLETYYTAAKPRNPIPFTPASSSVTPPTAAAPISVLEHSEDDDGAPTPTPSSPYAKTGKVGAGNKDGRSSRPGRPPPILKKAGSSGSSKSLSLNSPVVRTSETSPEAAELEPSQILEESSATFGSQNPASSRESPPTPRYVSTRFSEQVAVSIPQSPRTTLGGKGERPSRSLGESSLRSSRRGHVVYAGSVASRKRPIVMRQRSSQTSSPGKPSPTSPHYDPERSPEDDEELVASTENRKRAVSPHPRKGTGRLSLNMPSGEDETDDEEEEEEEEGEGEEEEEEEGEEEEEEGEEAEAAGNPTAEASTKMKTKTKALKAKSTSPLVEPDFRAKFADRPRPQQHRSFTNLSSAAWRSTAAAPAAASYQASGMMFPEQAPSAGRRGSGRGAFKEEIIPLKGPGPAGPDVKDDVTSLPRTKSQLTLLLERNRAAGQDPKGKGAAKP